MNTSTLFGNTQLAEALALIGGDALGEVRNDLLKQAIVAAAKNPGGGGGPFGTMAQQNANAVNITGGDLAGVHIDDALITSSAASGLTSTDQVTIVSTPAEDSTGYLGIPQNAQASNYTLVLTDAGKHLLHSALASAATYTIPANASVAFPIGTAITFINENGSTNVTIAINSDTLYLAGSGSTGSRTLTANGVATAIKIGATKWVINGTNLS